jgi:hypothetical protein
MLNIWPAGVVGEKPPTLEKLTAKARMDIAR